MRRPVAVPLLLCPLVCALAIAAWSCDGDGDPESSPTPPLATSTTLPATSAAASPTALPAAISIDEPPAGTTLAVPIMMSGGANVFEGALTIDALGDAGLVLCTRHVQATSGTGTPGTWEGILAFAPPDTPSPITLRAYNFSANDGAMENVVERSATVAAQQPNIVITSPACAANVGTGTLTASGMASVFEAVLFVDVRDAGGNVLLTERVMAAGGQEFSPWEATFDLSLLPGAGFYDLVAYNKSARDGAIENEFPVQIAVGP